jgi:signal transduction histidine kinase
MGLTLLVVLVGAVALAAMMPGLGFRRAGGAVALLGMAVLVTLAAGTALLQYRANLRRAAVTTARQAEVLLTAVEAGVKVHARRADMLDRARLSLLLDQLVADSEAEGIAISTVAGTGIMAYGVMQKAPETRWLPPASFSQRPPVDVDHVVFFRDTPLDPGPARPGMGPMGPPPGRGRGNPQMQPLPPGPYRIAVQYRLDGFHDQVARAVSERNLTLALAVGLAAAALAVVVSWRWRRRLASELEHARAEAVEQQRLAMLGAGLAHETKNPLGVVRGMAQSIAENPGGADVRAMAQRIVDEADRATGHISSFQSMARPIEPALENVGLDELLGDMAVLLRAEAPGEGIAIDTSGDGLVVRADAGMLRRALLNLGINAVRACEGSGTVRLSAFPVHGTVTLAVQDTGRGIAPEDLPRVTEPYFTRFAGGTGLGLPLVRNIARAHGWHLRIESAPGEGTTVFLEGVVAARGA